MKKSIIICFALVLGLSVPNTYAQESLEHYAGTLTDLEGHDKLKNQGNIRHFYSYSKWPKKYYVEDPVKFDRVGILSIMVRQDKSVSNELSVESLTLSEGTLQLVATKIAGPVEKALQEAGKEKGIEILTPKEYLTSEELIDDYLSIELEGGEMWEGENVQASLGYRPFGRLVEEGVTVGGIGAIKNSSFRQVGELCKKAQLDGIIIVVVTGYSAILNKYKDRKFLFQKLHITNFLVNQTPYMEDRKYPKLLGGYISMLPGGYSAFYAGGSSIMDFVKVGEGEIVSSDWRATYNGGLGITSSTVTRPKLNLVADYTGDLGKLAANFVPFYLDTVKWFIGHTNEKNKLD